MTTGAVVAVLAGGLVVGAVVGAGLTSSSLPRCASVGRGRALVAGLVACARVAAVVGAGATLTAGTVVAGTGPLVATTWVTVRGAAVHVNAPPMIALATATASTTVHGGPWRRGRGGGMGAGSGSASVGSACAGVGATRVSSWLPVPHGWTDGGGEGATVNSDDSVVR